MPAPALLIDFGGVLTTDVFASFATFCAGEGLEPGRFATLVREDPEAAALFVQVEKGEIAEAEFSRRLAPLLGPGVEPDGLLDRLIGNLEADDAMLALVEEVRAGGAKAVLVSNSFGMAAYEGFGIDERFDHVVLSGRVGIRKPSRAIYRLALERAGLDAADAVFVDDLEQNLVGARRVGIDAVLHTDAASTRAALAPFFGL